MTTESSTPIALPQYERLIVTGGLGHLPRRAYRVRDLVAILGLPKSTIHDLIRRGDIRAVSLGNGRRRIYLVPVEEVDRLLGGAHDSRASDNLQGV